MVPSEPFFSPPAKPADHYRSTFEEAAVGIAHVAPDGRWLRVNRAVSDITGYSVEELLGGSFQQITHPDDLSLDLSQLDMLLTGRADTYVIDKRYIRKNGTHVWVSLTVSLIRDNAGKPDFFISIIQDISSRKRIESQHRASEARFRAMFDSAVEAIAIIDSAGTVHSVNPGVERLFGYPPEEIVGRNIKLLMPASTAQFHDAYIERYRAGGPPAIIGIGREVQGKRKDGSSITLDLSVAEWTLDGNTFFTGMMRDLTARRAAEAALRSSETRLADLQNEYAHLARVNEMGEMAAAIAHEINQPLTAIANYLSAGFFALSKGASDSAIEEAREDIRDASDQALRAGEIVRRLRHFIGKTTGERSIEDLDALVDAGIRVAMIGASASGITLERLSKTQGAKVHVDPVQIQQVIVNVLRNAQDALAALPPESERKVTVSTSVSVDRAALEVIITDTGPGISAEVRAKLFEPFVTSKPSGMGIGLSICRRLMEAHDGSITLQRSDNTGTSFILRVPAFQSDRAYSFDTVE